MKILKIIFLLSLFALSSCLYKMPSDKYICTSPNVNNPHFTRERPNAMPGQKG